MTSSASTYKYKREKCLKAFLRENNLLSIYIILFYIVSSKSSKFIMIEVVLKHKMFY